jgi:hypothetical protein
MDIFLEGLRTTMKSISQNSRFQDQGWSLSRKNPKLNHNNETALVDPLIKGRICLVKYAHFAPLSR